LMNRMTKMCMHVLNWEMLYLNLSNWTLGWVLSPLLFAVFINDILMQLANSSLGCHINRICFNSYLYADDVLLLSISVCDMQEMIDICKKELDCLDMSINIKELVNNLTSTPLIFWLQACLAGTKSKEFRYLGLYIMAARSFKCNMHEPKMKYFRSLTGILGKVGTSCSLNVVLSLVNSFATPVLLYALEIVCLTTTEMNRLNYPFRSIFVKMFSTFNNDIIE